MLKRAVVFSDQDQEENLPPVGTKKQHIMLSRDEYREVVKEAYKEGIKDAAHNNDQDQQQKPQQQNAPNKKVLKEDKQSEHEKEGKRDAVRNEAQKMEENKQRVKAISERQDIELLRIKTVFPFNFFPDTIIIDTTKLTIMRKQFFSTEYISTVPLKDIADVTVQTALFLASISVKYMPQASSPGMLEPVVETINSLRRTDAIKAKNIMKGALVAKAEEIDIAKLSPEDVKTVIEKFGQSEGVE